jgi:predicted HTH domain antitoxin
MQKITISIPQTLSDRYLDINHLQKLMVQNFVIAEYQRGNLSIRDAATILEISYNEFVDLLGKYHLSFINADKSEITDNYNKFHSFFQLYR